MRIKNINFFFKPSCCVNCTCDNCISIGSNPLVEPMPASSGIFEYLDTIKHLDIYEFCITYDPRDNLSNKSRERNTRNKIGKYLKSKSFHEGTRNKYIILMLPEYNSSGILHWHGMMYFDNANYYYVHKLIRYCQRQFGRTMGKKVFNYDNYKTYMLKDQHHATIHKPIIFNTLSPEK